MKRFFITLSLLTMSLAMVSCDALDALRGGSATEQAPALNPNELRVYANAYDGFVNIRQGPSTKHKIIGRLNNGDDYLVQLGVQGNWILVKLDNNVGYVNASMAGYTPWPPVFLGVDADWVQGAYMGVTVAGGLVCDLLIFNNGKYAYCISGAAVACGVWRYEGKDIVLTDKLVTLASDEFGVGKVRRLPVDVINATVGGSPKSKFYNQSLFAAIKQSTNQNVRIK